MIQYIPVVGNIYLWINAFYSKRAGERKREISNKSKNYVPFVVVVVAAKHHDIKFTNANGCVTEN